MFFEIVFGLMMLAWCINGMYAHGKMFIFRVKERTILAASYNEVDSMIQLGAKAVGGALKPDITSEKRANLVIALKRLEKSREKALPRLRLYSKLLPYACAIACVMECAYALFFTLRVGHQLGQLQFIPIIHVPEEIFFSGILIAIGSAFASSKIAMQIVEKHEEIDDTNRFVSDVLCDEAFMIRYLRSLLVRDHEDSHVVH